MSWQLLGKMSVELNDLSLAEKNGPPHRVVSSIRITSLFGRHDVNIDFYQGDKDSYAIDFIYGANGSGKSTVLKLVYSALSSASKEGNRTYIGRVCFERMKVLFSDGLSVSIERNEATDGSYRYIVRMFDDSIFDYYVAVNDDGEVDDKLNPGIKSIDDFIRSIGINCVFISESRDIKSSFNQLKISDEENRISFDWIVGSRDSGAISPKNNQSMVSKVSDRLEAWLRGESIAGGFNNQSNVNAIYLDIARKLSGLTARTPKFSYTKKKIFERLENITNKYTPLERFGLAPHVEFSAISEAISACPSSSISQLGSSLKPYFDSIESRADELSIVTQIIATFVNEISNYYDGIVLSYDLRSGFSFSFGDGVSIRIDDLSSGQRQLFLIFSCFVLSRDQNAIVFIDEPEISLNIKWQRSLFGSIEKILVGSHCHVIAASHSIDVMSRYRAHISSM